MNNALNKKLIELQIENNRLKEELNQLQEVKKKGRLIGRQTRLDRNKNGRIDGEDFELLRKEKEVTEARKPKSPKLFSGETLAQHRARMDAAAASTASSQATSGTVSSKPKPATVAPEIAQAISGSGIEKMRKLLGLIPEAYGTSKKPAPPKPLTSAQRLAMGVKSSALTRQAEAGKGGANARLLAATATRRLEKMASTPQGRLAMKKYA